MHDQQRPAQRGYALQLPAGWQADNLKGRYQSLTQADMTRLQEAGYRNQLMVMQASGGVMTRDYIQGAPIRVLASGPAGGVIGSAHVGVAKGASSGTSRWRMAVSRG